jgi:hypothetical protein
MTADPQPLDHGELIVGLVDAIVALGVTLVGAGLISREALAQAYATAERQQASQPLSGPARQLACNMMRQFFAQPLLDGKPALREAGTDHDSPAGLCRLRNQTVNACARPRARGHRKSKTVAGR